jgi:hypothetical protein
MTFYAHSLRNAPRERWHRLAEHLEDTGSRAAAIAAKWGAETWGHAAGRLHDIGKRQAGRSLLPEHQLCEPPPIARAPASWGEMGFATFGDATGR